MNRPCFEIIESGQNAFLLLFGKTIDEQTCGMIGAFCAFFSRTKAGRSGLVELVPAYCSVTAYFDPLQISGKTVADLLRHCGAAGGGFSPQSARTHTVPVCYEGTYAPDMKSVADYTRLTEREIISLHSARPYLVYMLGFLPGFPYLGGMDCRLAVPRLKTPRVRIPAGSVGIGNSQTGIYPLDSPGGWQLIGRTPVKLFDPARDPQILFKAGDRIIFEPVTEREFERCGTESVFVLPDAVPGGNAGRFVVKSGFRVLSGGLLTTVQDDGRHGFQKDGVGVSGAMDRVSYAAANILAGNDPGTAVLETTVAGPCIQFVLPSDFVITGAPSDALLDGCSVPMNTLVHAAEGSVLDMNAVTAGVRSYIAFSGGVLVPRLFGSSSTNCAGRFGGYSGRRLQEGDELAVGVRPAEERGVNRFRKAGEARSGKRYAESSGGREGTSGNKTGGTAEAILKTLCTVRYSSEVPLLLRVLPGPQRHMFNERAAAVFTGSVYTVSADSDRMGCRLSGPPVTAGSTDIISDGVPCGAVQITSSGLPVVMAADRQTTGGYAKIAVVITADMPRLAQAAPGTRVQFAFVTQEEAAKALAEQERLLAGLESFLSGIQ